MSEPELILASSSPRRIELLRSLGLSFAVEASRIDETTELAEPAAIVRQLSLDKALEVAQRMRQRQEEEKKQKQGREEEEQGKRRTLILGADTIVVLDSRVLGKPQNRQEAFDMLMLLSGNTHKVYTGVSLLELPSGRHKSIHQVSSIHFRPLSKSEAEFYAATDEPMDKAGAYALQGTAAAFIDRVEGCYSNVIGLPVSDTVMLLREFGLAVMGESQNSKAARQTN